MITKGMYSNVIDEINNYIDRIDHILDELVRKGQMTGKIGIEYAFVNYVLHDVIVWVVMWKAYVKTIKIIPRKRIKTISSQAPKGVL